MISGIVLADGIALTVVGIICLILTIIQYQGKGPVLSALYFAATEEDRKKMQTKKAYRYVANVLLYPSISCLFFGISFILNNTTFSYIGTIIIVTGVLSGIVFLVTRK